MSSRFKIEKGGFVAPPTDRSNMKPPPVHKKYFTEEERLQKRKEAQDRSNAKRTKEYVKHYNDRAAENNTEEHQAAKKRAKAKVIAKRNAKLDEIAGRPKPIVCEVCGEGGKICFDHCHVHHHFRGWICDRCNKTLGLSKDSAMLLRNLADYLENDMLKNASKYAK